jgi:hypothetical protein
MFAIDACDSGALTQQLITQIKHADASWQWYALLDTAFDHQHPERLPLDNAINLFTPLHLQILEEVAPVLIPLQQDQQDYLADQLHRLFEHCSARPMLSFIALATPPDQLVKSWSKVHLVKTSDDEQYLLRLADTRVQPALAQALDAEHWAAIRAPLAEWLSIDRFGALIKLPTADEAAKLPKQLSDDTLNALLDLAQADAIWDYLLRDEPEPLLAAPRAKTAQNWQLIANYAKANDLDFGLLVALCRDALPHCHTAIAPAQIEALAARYQQLEEAEI